MMRWFNDDDLGEILDRVSPLTMRGANHADGLIAHPDWRGVYGKFGYSAPRPHRPQRLLLLWLRLERDHLNILTIREATAAEIAFYAEWAEGRR